MFGCFVYLGYKFMSRCCCFRNGILCFTGLVFYFRIVTLFFIAGVVSVRIVILYLTCAFFNLFRFKIDKTAKHNLSVVDHRDEYLTMLLYVRQHKVKSSNCSVVNIQIYLCL
jgi:hypothetical protein